MHKLPFAIRSLFVVSRRCIHHVKFISRPIVIYHLITHFSLIHVTHLANRFTFGSKSSSAYFWYGSNHSGFCESDFAIFYPSYPLSNIKRYSIFVTHLFVYLLCVMLTHVFSFDSNEITNVQSNDILNWLTMLFCNEL